MVAPLPGIFSALEDELPEIVGNFCFIREEVVIELLLHLSDAFAAPFQTIFSGFLRKVVHFAVFFFTAELGEAKRA